MNSNSANRWILVALFLTTLSTLMLETLLTRIFSVTLWYHFAFMVLSVALFGITVGALFVYLRPSLFPAEETHRLLAKYSLLFPVSIVICLLTLLSIPFVPETSLIGLYSIFLTYLVTAIPFFFSGICITLVLTRFSKQVSWLYAADLAGAALGSVMLIGVLRLTDGPTSVILVATLAGLAALSYSFSGNVSKRTTRLAAGLTALLGAFVVFHTVLVQAQSPLLRLLWVKNSYEERALYEKWNSFSRIRVTGELEQELPPLGTGISEVELDPELRLPQLMLSIDANADTVLTNHKGDLNRVDYLKDDVVNLAHMIRPNSHVLVVGAGGGRDVLSALVFQQPSVVAVEFNDAILEAVNDEFGDFTGHLDRDPRVRFVNDEARSYVARSRDQFDVIQISLTDTWAATAAGAFALTENALYTQESWRMMLDHLTPHGVLSVSRWYSREQPAEIYRTVALSVAALLERGVGSPREQILVVRRMVPEEGVLPEGIGTVLISQHPFSDDDLDTIVATAKRLGFEVVLGSRHASDPRLASMASGEDWERIISDFPLNIQPPTDDNPFFFQMLRLRDMFNQPMWQQGISSNNAKAVYILGVLLITVTGLTILCIIGPLLYTRIKSGSPGGHPWFVFFSAIGLGFMLIETSQLQRLTIFLGHPTYGLSVVLFSLLLASGIGSLLTRSISDPGKSRRALLQISFLLLAVLAFGLLTTPIIEAFRASPTEVRILVAVLMLVPLGLGLGMAFPLGMKSASSQAPATTPWLLGLNGATSVLGSVLAVTIALAATISSAYWTGFACYLIASAAFLWGRRKPAALIRG